MAITLTIISWLVLIGFLGLGAWKIRSGQTAVGVVLVVITLLAWPIWQWMRPHVAYADITGTEVKREDHDQNAKTPNRDVRYIYANDGRDRQFRNEDSWAWFKLNSDDTFGGQSASRTATKRPGSSTMACARTYCRGTRT